MLVLVLVLGGVDVMAPLPLSFLLISDFQFVMVFWRWTDGRTASFFLFWRKNRKTTHDGTFIAVFYVFLFKFIRTNERMNQSIAVLYLHHHFTPSPPPRPLSSFTHPSALLIVVLFVRVVVFTQLRPQWWKSSCLAHDFHSTNGGGGAQKRSPSSFLLVATCIINCTGTGAY